RKLILDSISAFGALPLDVAALPCAAMIGAPNKCLEGVPGLAFVIVERDLLAASRGRAHSLVLDLYDQWRRFEGNGQWRFTPPTHVLAALDRALEGHEAEGGIDARRARYQENRRLLVDGMRGLGLETYLPDALQAPIIVTFHAPADGAFDFETFYGVLARDGFLIYPGKLTAAETFRIGCIGQLGPEQMREVVAAAGRALDHMGVEQRGRAAA
ncbi:MAG: 2-aminoethylphosphonate--pyruvate transaminase, partial [Alphaproteobacteria bacterium]|nr:2-aminoethylphosphonate--pyruvate transaminase [Alphaproteobacteria bacterium]